MYLRTNTTQLAAYPEYVPMTTIFVKQFPPSRDRPDVDNDVHEGRVKTAKDGVFSDGITNGAALSVSGVIGVLYS